MSKRQRKSTADRQKSIHSHNASPSSPRDESGPEAMPLVGLEPTNPPKKNVTFLAITATLFLVWIGILLWIAFTS